MNENFDQDFELDDYEMRRRERRRKRKRKVAIQKAIFIIVFLAIIARSLLFFSHSLLPD